MRWKRYPDSLCEGFGRACSFIPTNTSENTERNKGGKVTGSATVASKKKCAPHFFTVYLIKRRFTISQYDRLAGQYPSQGNTNKIVCKKWKKRPNANFISP